MNSSNNTYIYATDSTRGQIRAATVTDAYRSIRATITPEMLAHGASLWVEPTDSDSAEIRITMGVDAD